MKWDRLGRLGRYGYVGGLVLGLGLVGIYGAVEVSSKPRFCGSCHVMSPYYESWTTSGHAEIACVECHIPPGITAEIEKKYEALAMVASYFTGTYGTNPWAEVEDEACLACHSRRLLVGQELYGEVLFDHGPHLAELRRGKKLRCTSCHSQIVQGSHITVTPTTCILCHFKGETPGTGTARCTLCHQVPDRVLDAGGVRFDHSEVSRFGMACEACHTPAGPRQGAVPRERCFTCHNDPSRLEEYGEGDFLHQTHVTDHKIECTDCHLEIEHVAPRHLEAARTECDTCHAAGHSPQRNLYAGLGGKGVEPMPDVMYRAGVRCEGCHFDHGDGGTSTAGEVSCMSCHGPGYRKIFESWSSTVTTRTAALRRQVDATGRALGPEVPTVFADARDNLELVERAHGIHNVRYSQALLTASHGMLNQARAERGLGALALPWPEGSASPCMDCHAGAETGVARAFGRRFPHRPHAVERGLACETCHTTHEEREETGASPLKLEPGSCNACHHGEATEATCESCHAGFDERTWPTEVGDFDHEMHVEMMEIPCAQCHGEPPALSAPDGEVCSECH